MNIIKLTRVELYEMVWKEPMSKIANQYNITDTDLRKACIRMNIPTPSNGHWMKLMHGKPSPKTELPDSFEGDGIFEIQQLGKESVVSGESDLTRKRKEILADPTLNFKVPSSPKNACKLVTDVYELFQKERKEKHPLHNGMLHSNLNYLDLRAAPENANRMLCFADALIKNLKARGHDVIVKNNETRLLIYGEDLQIGFREYTRRSVEPHPEYTWLTSHLAPTGVLSFRIIRFYEREWKDGKTPIEEQLPNILAQLELIGLKAKADTEKREAWHKEYQRQRKEDQDILERKQKEIKLFNDLLAEAKHFNEAEIIRKYVENVEQKIGSDSLPEVKTKEWIEWAKAKADWLDPLVSKKDLILGDFSSKLVE